MRYEFDFKKAKDFIKKQGLTIEMVAVEMGVTGKTVICWLSGRHRPGWPAIKSLARLLGKKEEDLLVL